MDVAADALFLAAHHQRDLTVCFQPQQTVDNVAAGFFQHLRPENIVFLVKTGFQLNQNRHLFPLSAASASAAIIGELPLTR